MSLRRCEGGVRVAARRVFVIWTHPLFHDSARLLLKHPDVDWVGAASSPGAAREGILRLEPDTVLFEKTGTVAPLEVLRILVAGARDMRIIGLSLEDNEISLYQRERRAMVEASDLLALVLDRPGTAGQCQPYEA